MKKTYIIPNTTAITYISNAVCQVASVQGNAGLQYSGGTEGGTIYDPM